MATKKKTASKNPATRNPAAKAATKKPAAKKTGDKTSALDAAAKVLGDSKDPLTTKEMIDAMGAKGYWKTKAGKTPERTLYSAVLREIVLKKKESRFVKTERGKFKLAK